MTTISGLGPSYDFWLRTQQELQKQMMSQRELIERSKVSHTVIMGLKSTSIHNRAARCRNVLAIAEVLGIPEEEALQLAGLTEPPLDPQADVRAVIRSSPAYDEAEKEVLYRLLDVFDRSRSARRGQDERRAG